jgi:two-component system sensor histidine kinase MprB
MLVADASHELRTPLTSLTTNLELLEDGAGLADPQAPALVRAAREQAGELDRLITDLLDLARYRESSIHRETVRLDLLTDEAVRRLRHRADIDTDTRPCLVEVDPIAVDRAISNLIDNAIKWSPTSRGTRRRRQRQGVVTDHGPASRCRPPAHLRTLLPGTGGAECRRRARPGDRAASPKRTTQP